MTTSNPALCTTGISRRGFLAGVGGLTLVYMAGNSFALKGVLKESAARAFHPNVWATIETDGRITIMGPAAEMGQGSLTALPLIFAEELDADWADVVPVQVSELRPEFGNPTFGGLIYTGGSRAVADYYKPLRLAGAQARRLLMKAAAAHWRVPLDEVATEPSVVVHGASGRRLTYGAIAGFAEVPETLPEITEADLKSPADFRLIGRDTPRKDGAAKVTGQAQYAMDVQVPGMVYAAILHAPVEGERPVKIDDRETLKVAGVLRTVELDHAVAVIAETVEATRFGKDVLDVTWSTDSAIRATGSSRTLAAYSAAANDLSRTGTPWRKQGDVDAVFTKANKVIQAEYQCDYVYHAQMEPLNATARVSESGDAAELWTGTQSQTLSVLAAAKVLGTKPDKITLHQMLLGGGFGRRAELEPTYVVEAVQLSKLLKTPVKVIWSREDDIQNGWFRPATAQVMRAGLDKDGNVIAWNHRMAGPSVLAFYNTWRWSKSKGRDIISMHGSDLRTYAIPNILAEHVIEGRQARLSPWRGVATGYTKFAVESFVDELAHAQKMGPIAFRIQRMNIGRRARRALEAVAKDANWGGSRGPGRALGIAVVDYFASVAAGVVEISLDRATGKIRVHNVWVVADPGLVVQPRNVRMQLEGAAIYGLGQSLSERITIKEGAVQQSNYNDYLVMRMIDVPDIHARLLPSDMPPSGVGELALPLTGGAIANAFFALTGKRLRHMPLTPERVRDALKA